MTTNQEKNQGKRDAKGRFLPGLSGNPGGCPQGKNKALLDIQNAILEFEKEKGISYWKAATLIAMKLANEGNANLLGKILDKFVPSKLQAEGFGGTFIYVIRDGENTRATSNRVGICATQEPVKNS